jgi:acetyltransferase-like isoleucine patch superfamily enzyme
MIQNLISSHPAFARENRIGTPGWSLPSITTPSTFAISSANVSILRDLGVRLANNESASDPAKGDNRIVMSSAPKHRSINLSLEHASNCLVLIDDFAEFNINLSFRGSNHILVLGAVSSMWLDFIFYGSSCGTFVGSGTTCNSGIIFSFGDSNSIQIGDDCMLANAIDIRNSDGHAIVDLDNANRINRESPIIIGPHVWLGERSVIRKGVEIGAGSILGGNSIATKSLPPRSAAAGAPATVIRSNVSWTRDENPDRPAIEALKERLETIRPSHRFSSRIPFPPAAESPPHQPISQASIPQHTSFLADQSNYHLLGATPNQGYRIGHIATRATIGTHILERSRQAMARSRHTARSDIVSLRIIYSNWYVDYQLGCEMASAQDAFVAASIEYPPGVFHQATWDREKIGRIPVGDDLVSDEIFVKIRRGSTFFVRTWMNCESGIICADKWKISDSLHGDYFSASDVTIEDLTMKTVELRGAATEFGIAPTALVSATRHPSAFIAGDSRAGGLGDLFDGLHGDKGEIARSIGPRYGYINAGVAGDWLHHASRNFDRRRKLARFCSHVILNYGINDLYNGRKANDVLSDLKLLQQQFDGLFVIQTTLAPVSTSTDGWSSENNQTPHMCDANRIAFNQAIRAGFSLAHAHVDNASAVESARNSGIWSVGQMSQRLTDDGLHPNLHGYLTCQLANAIHFQSLIGQVAP